MTVNKLYVAVLIVCFLLPFYTISAEQVKEKEGSSLFTRSIYFQPCTPHDSCDGRCVGDSVNQELPSNVTIGHLNCFCDPDCLTFGDCCWDYTTHCTQIIDVEPRKRTSKIYSSADNEKNKEQEDEEESNFECVNVDEMSKDSFWMVASCHPSWPDDHTRTLCKKISENDFMSRLPVISDDGWTYRNVFCAQCNNVTTYDYWSIKAHCERSAPHQVISGDPEMLSYYLHHFCSAEMQQGVQYTTKFAEISKFKFQSKWRKSLRPCQTNMISECPSDYQHSLISETCKNYQSIVIAEKEDDYVIFKNPVCALCHGYTEENIKNIDVEEDIEVATKKRNLKCPVWLRSQYYDMPYWTVSSESETYRILPAFSSEYKSSKWIPPSFSVIMQFRDSHSEVTYEDGDTSLTIPPAVPCTDDEIYDPFCGTCRTVYCRVGYTFTEDGCIEDPISEVIGNSSANFTTPTSPSNIVGLVTVQVEIPIPNFDVNNRRFNSSEDAGFKNKIVEILERFTNQSLSDVTVVARTGESSSTNKTQNHQDYNQDGKCLVTFSFVVLEEGTYNNTEIMELVDSLSELFSFDNLNFKSDEMELVVVETSNSHYLECKNTTKRNIYRSSQFEIMTDYNNTEFMFVNTSGRIYPKSQYQLLDWKIDVNSKQMQTSNYERARAAVCVQVISSNASICVTYVELNKTEFILLSNGSIFIPELNSSIAHEDYFIKNDGAVICIDNLFDDVEKEEELIGDGGGVPYVISWVVFVLTLIALLMLIITFLIYCFLSELRTIAGWNIMNLVVGKFAALLTFMVGASWTSNYDACIGISILLHYLFLSTFFWNSVMAYDVWTTFGKGFNQTFARSQIHRHATSSKSEVIKRTLIKYMIYGWGTPAVIVAICAIIEFGVDGVHFGYRPDPNQVRACWISNPLSNLLAFGVPLMLILLMNGVFFTISTLSIRRSTKASRNSSMDKQGNSNKHTKLASRRSDSRDNDDSVFTRNQQFSGCNRPNIGSKKTRSPSIISTRSTKSTASGLIQVNLMLYVRMSTVMGFTWAIGIAAAIVNNSTLWYIFEVSVPMQGVLIFASFVCKVRVYNLIRKRFGLRQDEGKTCQIPEEIFQAQQQKRKRLRTISSSQTISIPMAIAEENSSTEELDEEASQPPRENSKSNNIQDDKRDERSLRLEAHHTNLSFIDEGST